MDPALIGTNGYDYRNNQDGDTYVFLLGSGIEDWAAGERPPCPALRLQGCALEFFGIRFCIWGWTVGGMGGLVWIGRYVRE